MRKKRKEDEQTLEELNSAHRRSQAKFQLIQTSYITAVISHTRPQTIFSHFKNYVFGGRQSNVSMTITTSTVTGTTTSMSILRVSELLFQLYLTRR